jgi:pimeloyl-ACP methyl ester carboxylesterase
VAPAPYRRSMRTSHRTSLTALLVGSALTLTTACSSPSAAPETDDAAPPAATTEETGPPTTDAQDDGDTSAAAIRGPIDVGGHTLWLECTGSGSPTILYLHGAIFDEGVMPHQNANVIRQQVDNDYRFCAYDRRNVGRSQTVDGPQHVDDIFADFETLLTEAELEPPFVLLGASFGGTLGHIYSTTNPNDVLGMVLLDAMFPDMMLAEELAPEDERFEAFHEEDLNETPERISHFDVMTRSAELIGQEPAIPVVYFASEREPMESEGIPEWDAAIPGLRAEFVDRYSPGTLTFIDAPHFMEPAIPNEIADALREVIAQATT